MSEDQIYVLRDLAGVLELEAILQRCQLHQNPKWAPERVDAEKLAAKISQRCFGITEADTRFQKNHLLAGYENEHNFSIWEGEFDFLRKPAEEQVGDWEDLGWDVAGPNGTPLLSVELLGRQIVASSVGLAGHLPDEAPELSEQEQSEIEAQLRADAAKFKRGK